MYCVFKLLILSLHRVTKGSVARVVVRKVHFHK